LLLWNSSKKTKSTEHGEDHVWDENLREDNNPLPLWWVYLFVITSLFGLGYLMLYPGLGDAKGSLNWSSSQELQADIQANQAKIAPLYAKFDALSFEEVAKNPDAMAIASNLFLNNCAQCHAYDAKGSKGFPNLTDKDWLHGGTPEKIQETITLGRLGQMPPMAAALGTPEDVQNVAQYVLSLSGSPHDADKAAKGQAKFMVCAACHGVDGKGNTDIGSANLTDNIWLHGFGDKAIEEIITHGKVNQMPAQKDRLSASQIRILSAYVWRFSNAN
jgi:cytochrome c oxidase cbb3-type subunit 3